MGVDQHLNWEFFFKYFFCNKSILSLNSNISFKFLTTRFALKLVITRASLGFQRPYVLLENAAVIFLPAYIFD